MTKQSIIGTACAAIAIAFAMPAAAQDHGEKVTYSASTGSVTNLLRTSLRYGSNSSSSWKE